MRLTLRTLLAYLDDTLVPSQAREIGQKVAESPPAKELIERIHRVARRRRLGAPSPESADAELDANLVAQYLDNTLSADETTHVEETCLQSDMHLAEVASCHQILTHVLSEPLKVPPTARERMYQLVPEAGVSSRRKREKKPEQENGAQAAGQDERDEALLLGLPLGSQKSGIGIWALVASVFLLVGGLAALWMTVRSIESDLAIPARTPPSTVIVDLKPAPTFDQKAPEPARETAPAPPVPEPAPVKAPEKTEATNPPPAPAPTPEPSRPPINIPPVNTRHDLGRPALVPGSVNLLLQRGPDQAAWKRVAPEKSRVLTGDRLLMLPGARGEVRFDSGVHLQLWGNLPEFAKLSIPVLEALVTLNGRSGFDLDFTLERGRVLLTNHKTEGPATIRVRFRDQIWDITLPDAHAEVGMELVGTCLPYSKNMEVQEAEVDVALLVLKGPVSLKVGHEEQLLQQTTLVTWDSLPGAAKQARLLGRLPEWAIVRVLPATSAARDASQALEAIGNLSTNKSMDIVLAEGVRSTEPAMRVLSVRCLAALDDVAALLDLISDPKRPDLRSAGVDGLIHVLSVNPQGDDMLALAARGKNYPDSQIETMHQLLHGFSPEQWSVPATRLAVVEYLQHDKLTIRQLALSLLLRMFPEGQRIGFDPTADQRKRDRAYDEWKTLVQQKRAQGV